MGAAAEPPEQARRGALLGSTHTLSDELQAEPMREADKRSVPSTSIAAPPSTRIPSATAGIALGLCGVGSILTEFHSWGSWVEDASLVFTSLAAVVWLIFTSTRLLHPRLVVHELRLPAQVASYGAWQMVLLFLASRLVRRASPEAARALIALGGAIQLGLLTWFVYVCWRTGTEPEPFWNPPTVNVAVSTVRARRPSTATRDAPAPPPCV